MNKLLTKKEVTQARAYCASHGAEGDVDPRVEALVTELLARVSDKWTMLILELLEEKGEMRFTRIADSIEGISQKMLTQTLRQMERDGLVRRTVHPVIPPRVDYQLTPLGRGLGEAFCGVWMWAGENLEQVNAARRSFDAKVAKSRGLTAAL
jgi:DNA-binding HxlR family transcriptional regulator